MRAATQDTTGCPHKLRSVGRKNKQQNTLIWSSINQIATAT